MLVWLESLLVPQELQTRAVEVGVLVMLEQVLLVVQA
jgi:hypothetical protein